MPQIALLRVPALATLGILLQSNISAGQEITLRCTPPNDSTQAPDWVRLYPSQRTARWEPHGGFPWGFVDGNVKIEQDSGCTWVKKQFVNFGPDTITWSEQTTVTHNCLLSNGDEARPDDPILMTWKLDKYTGLLLSYMGHAEDLGLLLQCEIPHKVIP